MTSPLRLTTFLTKTTWWILFTSLNKLDTAEYPANPACVWLKMHSCTWSVWSTSCGFSVDQEMMTNYLHHWFMNKWKKNDFPLLHSAGELCESSCKQSVCQTQVLQGSTNKALCTTSIQSTIKWYAVCFDYTVTQPRRWLPSRSERISTLTHT